MLEKFTAHIEKQFPFLQHSQFYVAVSGGIDSMVLVHLFQHFSYEFGIVHCNFKLRGDESDADMRFIHDYADENRLHLRIGFFETEQIAKENKTSIQVTARTLRYNWFNEQMDENNVDFVATAHHADDNLETFLINLSRGTGLEGLTGIPKQNDRIIRPLLPFTRDEIERYARENNVKWREDSSNESDKYIRNKIRHHIVPLLKELNPSFLDSFQKTQSYLNDAQSLVSDAESIVFQEVVSEKEDGTYWFDLKNLLKLPNYNAYLYQWLKEFEFTAWNDIYDLVTAQSGKKVVSDNFILLKNRDFLILYRKETTSVDSFLIHKENNQVNIPIKFSICNVSDISVAERNCIFVDEDELQFPLTLRKYIVGDYFYPFGMNGKKKLISKYLKDEKISLKDKEHVWVLSSENKIVWLVNYRLDDRFKVSNKTKKIVKITIE